MTTPPSRRDFVKSAGGLVVGFAMGESWIASLSAQAATQAATQAAAPPAAVPAAVGTPLTRIDSWLRIAPDGL